MSEKFLGNPPGSKTNTFESLIPSEVATNEYNTALDRLQRSLRILCVDIDSQTNHVYLKLQVVISRLKNQSIPDVESLEKLKILLISFFDLVKIDRMVSYEEETAGDITKQSYGREDEDLSKIYVAGPRAEKKLLNQDNYLAWINGAKDEKLDEFFNQEIKTDNQLIHNSTDDGEDAATLIDEIISSLESLESNRSDRYYRRKTQVVLSSGNLDLDRFTERHKEHYRHFFTNQEGVPPNEVILTNSGSRANEAVLKALVKSGCSKVFIQEGWYYENIKTAKTYMDESPIDEADVFLLNADSSQPIDDAYYQSIFSRNLAAIADRATTEPNKTFYLVVDSTCDLLKLEDWHIPANVTLVKTYSATKHQRGGHNYFFGGAAIYGSDKLARDIESEVVQDDADISGLSALHYPRLRQTEIRENTEKIHGLNKALQERLAIAQSGIPPALRIQCHSYNYYSYLEFPLMTNHISGITEKLKELTSNFFSDEVSREYAYERGDSFGLDTTRLCSIGGKFFKCIRFSPGTSSDEQQMERLADHIGSTWSDFIVENIPKHVGKKWHGNREEYLEICRQTIRELESLFQNIKNNPHDKSNIERIKTLLHPSSPTNIFYGRHGDTLDDEYRSMTSGLTFLLIDLSYFSSDEWSQSMLDQAYFRLETVKDIVSQTLAIYDTATSQP